MTAKEYISELASELQGFDAEIRRDILLEIEDHIGEFARQHPEMSEEEIIAGLEKPQVLAESLRAEAEPSAGKADAQGSPKASRFVLAGEGLSEIIRKALSIAELFNDEQEPQKEDDEEEDDDDDGEDYGDDAEEAKPGHMLRLKDIPLRGIKEIVCETKSADIKILRSDSGLGLQANGKTVPFFTIKKRGPGSIEIRTSGRREARRLALRVPASVERLSLKTQSGDVSVADWEGSLAVQSASGDVNLRRCEGDVSVSTASGDVAVSGCGGKVVVESASGSVSLRLDEDCQGAAVSCVSGDIELRYAQGVDALIRCDSVSGDMEHDCEESESGRLKIGAGLIPVALRTVSGDIKIRALKNGEL